MGVGGYGNEVVECSRRRGGKDLQGSGRGTDNGTTRTEKEFPKKEIGPGKGRVDGKPAGGDNLVF